MGKLLEQRNRELDDINAGRTVKKIRDLESRVRELEEENARLKAECDDIKQVQFPRKLEAVAVGWKKQLAAEQLNNKRLREALKMVTNKVCWSVFTDSEETQIEEALSTLTDAATPR